VAVVEAGVWAWDGAELARSCDAASLQGFGVIGERSLNHPIRQTLLQDLFPIVRGPVGPDTVSPAFHRRQRQAKK